MLETTQSPASSATHHHVLLLDFAVQSDTQNPTLILLEQVILPSLMPDARINTPENNLNFMKIYCNPSQNVNLVYQLIPFKANKLYLSSILLQLIKCNENDSDQCDIVITLKVTS